MKLFKVTEKDGSKIQYQGHLSLLQKLPEMGHGKPERWVLHKDEPMAEDYDEADVLEEKVEEIPHSVVASEDGESQIVQTQKWVKLKAEYTVTIEDITAQYELDQAIIKRKAEYPTAEEFMNAFFDGGEDAIAALQEKRLLIKQKYPKP